MLRNMNLYRVTSFGLFLLVLNGMFGVDADEVKSVSLMEGDSVTLHTHLTDIQRDDLILWIFGPQETRIAEIHTQRVNMYNSNETFGDRLKLNSQTGSLTITNIRITDSGLYKLQIISNRGTSYKRFNVTVYARLPVPVITRMSNSSNCSSSSERFSMSNCVLLCSVMNVTHVSLSWYKGNSLLSSISVSDLNIRLSLPLEVEYHDTNTYRCVINNTITNQTQHLDITQLCGSCPDSSRTHIIVAVIISAVLAVLVLAVINLHCKKRKRLQLEGKFEPREHTVETSEVEFHYNPASTFCRQNPQKERLCESETIYYSEIIYSGVST